MLSKRYESTKVECEKEEKDFKWAYYVHPSAIRKPNQM